MTPRAKNKYTVILRDNENETQKSYRINQRIFYMLDKNLEKYRSYSPEPKKIKCVETGQVFNSAREASHWVEDNTETEYCNHLNIKQACKGKQETSYGFHWEFV